MAAKKRRKGKKQSGDRASRIAGALLKWMKETPGATGYRLVKERELKTICASVLSQDETKGSRK